MLFLPLLFIAVSCSEFKYDYIGKSYPKTKKIDVFFRPQDVNHDYEVMGEVLAQAPYDQKLIYIQPKIERVARKYGADAVLFPDLDVSRVGFTSDKEGVESDTTRLPDGKKVDEDRVKRISVKLLKYK